MIIFTAPWHARNGLTLATEFQQIADQIETALKARELDQFIAQPSCNGGTASKA